MDTLSNFDAPQAKILLADDDEMFRNGFSRLLQSEGYNCSCAADGSSALELLRTTNFDALISDIYMPGNVGLELIQNIPQISSGLPVFLLTGRPSMETAVKSVNLSVSGYLMKPPDIAQLKPMLDRAIEAFRTCKKIGESRKMLEKWAYNLEYLEKTLKRPDSGDKAVPVAQYLQLMSKSFISMLEDMEQTLGLLMRLKNSGDAFREHEYLNVLQQTMDVLEQTRQSFKSRRLGQLREELGDIIKQRQLKQDSK